MLESVIVDIPTRQKGSQSAQSIEDTIFSLRQLYAMIYLLEADAEGDDLPYLDDNSSDIERKFVPHEEELRFEDVRLGSFIAVITAIGHKCKAVASLALIFYPRGRENLERRIEATTTIQEMDVETKRLHNEGERIRNELEQLKLEKERHSAEAKQLEELMRLEKKISKIKDSKKRIAWQREFSLRLGRLNVIREVPPETATIRYNQGATPPIQDVATAR